MTSDSSGRPDPSFRSAFTWQTVLAATILAALAAGAVLWFALGDSDDNASADDETIKLTDPVEVGKPLDVELKAQDATTTSLRNLLDGRPMVVNLFGSWCTPCVREMPDLQAAYTELAGSVDFVGVALQDRPEDTADIVEQTGVTYPWFGDRDGNLLTAVEGNTMPTTFLVGADGTIVTVRAGALNRQQLLDLIAESFPGVT